jgi:hypothetical protein
MIAAPRTGIKIEIEFVIGLTIESLPLLNANCWETIATM